MLDKEVIVIGAGLAGLSAALTLQSAGCRVNVIEASNRAGGRVASDQIDGFILDRGFQLINARYPELQRLGVVEALDFQVAERAVDVALQEESAVIGDPRSHLFAGISNRTGSLSSKIGFLKYLVTSASKNANVADDLSSLGPLYEKVLRPFLSGVFLTDPSNVGAVPGKENV
jgi:phytoene dehydrogenase-like protein